MGPCEEKDNSSYSYFYQIQQTKFICISSFFRQKKIQIRCLFTFGQFNHSWYVYIILWFTKTTFHTHIHEVQADHRGGKKKLLPNDLLTLRARSNDPIPE